MMFAMRLALASLSLLTAAFGQAPAGYYSAVVTTTPAQLRATLHDVIDDHARVPFSSSSPGANVWSVLEVADQDPADPTRVLDVYRNRSYAKAGGLNFSYFPESAWPAVYGFPNENADNYPYSDCHGLFLCNVAYRLFRAFKVFDTGSASWTELTTTLTGGLGGGSGVYPGNSNWTTLSGSPGGFEVWGERRGDLARAMFYMDVRYEGGTHQSGSAEPDLILTDDEALISASSTGNNESVGYMGKLSVLLQWHAADPVDAKEMAHNNAVYAAQGNRNPFVDQPAWVDCIYGGQCSSVTAAREPECWINELHYDNVGPDQDERVEIAGRAEQNVNGWMLLAYDSATGAVYDRVSLRGTFPAQQNGFGTLSFPFPGLADGAGAIALVTTEGVVCQFLSYGGVVTASNGACKGRLSTDIGVTEDSSTPVGASLQLTGVGEGYAQFQWTPPAPQTPGAPNTNQNFL